MAVGRLVQHIIKTVKSLSTLMTSGVVHSSHWQAIWDDFAALFTNISYFWSPRRDKNMPHCHILKDVSIETFLVAPL